MEWDSPCEWDFRGNGNEMHISAGIGLGQLAMGMILVELGMFVDVWL